MTNTIDFGIMYLYNLIGDLTPKEPHGFIGYGRKTPLENKRLLVRVTLAGHIWKRVWVEPKGFIAMAGSLLLSDSLSH